MRDVFEVAAAAPLGPLDAQRVLEADATQPRSAVLQRYLGELADELRARLAEVGGTLELETSPRGTVLAARIPLED